MISYDTGIVQPPPITPSMRHAALAGLTAQRSTNYSIPFADVYDARAQQAGIDLEREAVRANNEHLAKTHGAQTQLALQGGNLMQTGQQNRANLESRQRGMALDYTRGIGELLAGLYS